MGRKRPKGASVQTTPSPPQGGAGAMTSALIGLAIALFVLTRFYILFVLRPQISDVPLYYQYAASAIDLHQTPYRSDFEVEYPPLALWTTYVPRLLDDRSITNPQDSAQVMTIYIDYNRAFRGLLFLCDLASFVILLLIVRKRRPRLAGWAALAYTIATAILGHLLYDRLDVGLLMLLMLLAYSWTRSLEDSKGTIAWTAAAYALLGLSISFKVIPLICVPFLLLAEFHAPRRQARLTSALAALAAGIGVPFLIQYAASGPGVFLLLKHHAEREIQLESLYSTLMLLASIFGAQAFVSHSHGAYELAGNLAHAMKILSTILLLGLLGSLGSWAFFRRARYSRQDAYRFTCYIIPAAVILSNVLSPQYFIWAFPLLILLAVEILPAGSASPWMLGASIVAAA